jgi:hypothetical protein
LIENIEITKRLSLFTKHGSLCSRNNNGVSLFSCFSVQLTFVKRESHPPTPKQLQLYKAIHSPLSVRFLTKIVFMLILTQKKRRYDEGWNGRLLYRNSLLVSAKLNESI